MTADCLCAGVPIEITGKLGPVVTCHCTSCRKAGGSAFAANADVRRECWRFVDPGRRPLAHFHVASRAPWFEIPDALPQFAGGSRDREA